MVQVIGKDPQVLKRVTCHNCASILEYILSEVKFHRYKDHTGGSAGKEWIDCPQCGKEVTLRSW